MSRMFFLIVTMAAFILCPRLLQAVEITDERDRKYTGEIMDEDEKLIYLDSKEGLVTIHKAKIKTMDGKPYGKAPQPEVEAPSAPAFLETEKPAPAKEDQKLDAVRRGGVSQAIQDEPVKGKVKP